MQVIKEVLTKYMRVLLLTTSPPPLLDIFLLLTALKAQARLRDTLYGTVVIELMAVQDLFMAPLLAIPTALSHIVWQQTPVQLVVTLGSYGVGIAAVLL